MRGTPGRLGPAAVTVLAAALSCVPELSDMTPFPCADDGSCPEGLSCTPGVGCVHAQLDSPCAEGQTECDGAGPGAACSLGICTVPCDDKRPCGSDHICSTPAAAGAGVCVFDCSAGQTCPPGLSCRPLGYGTASGCIAGAASEVPLDGPCSTNADCANAGTDVTCQLGACSTPCGPDLPCDAAHVCSSYEDRTAGACLVDCTSSGSCVQGLQCTPVGWNGEKACLGPGQSVTTCTTDLSTDAHNCGACGHACGPLEACTGGACTCTKTTCGSACVDTSSDGKNCGACGHDCLGGACSGATGYCEPVTVGPVATAWLVGADAARAYFSTSTQGTDGLTEEWVVDALPLSGGPVQAVLDLSIPDGVGSDAETLFDGSSLYRGIYSYQTSAGRVIKVTPGSAATTLYAADVPDAGPTNATTDISYVSPGLVVFSANNGCLGGHLDGAWMNGTLTNEVVAKTRVNLPPVENEVPDFHSVTAFDGQSWFSAFGDEIDLIGGILGMCQLACCAWQAPVAQTPLIDTLQVDELGDTTLVAMLADSGSLYFLGDGDQLEALDTTTKALTHLATGLATPRALLLDPTYVYWFEQGTSPAFADGAVRRVGRTGGAVETVAAFSGAGVKQVVTSPAAFVWSDATDLHLLAR